MTSLAASARNAARRWMVGSPYRSWRDRLLSMTFVVGLWWLVSLALADGSFPDPAGTARQLAALVGTGSVIESAAVTATRILTGFAIGFLGALIIGVIVGSTRLLGGVIEPWINLFRPIAPFAWIPMAILWFGIGTSAAVFIVAYATFFPVVISVIYGVRSVDRRLVLAARTLGARRRRVISEIVIPSALPAVLIGARLGMGTAWTSVIAAELTVATREGSTPGLGERMVITIGYNPDLNIIMALIVVVGVIALLLDTALRGLYHRLVRWPA